MLKFVAPDGKHWYLAAHTWPSSTEIDKQLVEGPVHAHMRVYEDIPPYGTIVEFKLENAEAIYELGALDYNTGCYEAKLVNGAIYSGVK